MFIDNTTKLGSSFVTAVQTSGVYNIFTAASNTNGIIVRTVVVGSDIQVVADTSAPSGYFADTPGKRTIFWASSGATFPVVMPYPVLVPADSGLWMAVGSDTTGSAYAVTWEAVTS